VTRTPTLSLKDRESINKRECLLRIILVGTGEEDCERNSPSIANQMTFAARFCSVSWIRSCLPPQKKAPIVQLSTIAVDQSILEQRESQSNSAKCIRSQMPASSSRFLAYSIPTET
jgi:hypothetical protein